MIALEDPEEQSRRLDFGRQWQHCEAKAMKPQLFRDRHPRPHHKDAAVHTQVDATCGKVGFDELATNGIQLYDVAKYGVGGALVA